MTLQSNNNETARLRLKVCFIIRVNGAGLGGHYRSLRTTVDALSKRCDCVVVSFGPKPSPVFAGAPAVLHHIPSSALDVWGVARALAGILRLEAPQVINSFDMSSLFIARLMQIRFSLPVVHTKCGGANPRRYFPLADSFVLYSQENLEFFASRARFSGIPLRLIPNRVQAFDCVAAKVTALRRFVRTGAVCFLRINRIASSYEATMLQSIALIQKLNEDGHDCQLILVGEVQDSEVLERIKSRCDENVVLLTDETFTRQAREAIDAADFVIGTGRGFMEAACRGKVLLTPIEGATYPLLISEENFQDVFKTNFSERNRVGSHDEQRNYTAIREAVSDKAVRDKLSAYSSNVFERYFNIEAAAPIYEEVLRGARRRRGWHAFDLLLNGYCYIVHERRSKAATSDESGRETV